MLAGKVKAPVSSGNTWCLHMLGITGPNAPPAAAGTQKHVSVHPGDTPSHPDTRPAPPAARPGASAGPVGKRRTRKTLTGEKATPRTTD